MLQEYTEVYEEKSDWEKGHEEKGAACGVRYDVIGFASRSKRKSRKCGNNSVRKHINT